MTQRQYWVGFNLVRGIGPAKVRALLDHFGNLQQAWHAAADDLKSAGLDRRAIESLITARSTIDLHRAMAAIDAAGIATLCWDDDNYPPRLRDIANPPPLLYVRGDIVPADGWAIAMVGTRRATAYGRDVAQAFAAAFAAAGITVVSGFARGIDTVAHQAALDAGGRTLAVLGSGLDQLYPPEQAPLAGRIAANGALISDYPLGTPPDSANFPPRNRIISGLSLGVVVIEAGEESGALITADFAAEHGRDVFSVPGNVFSRSSRGTNNLIRNGAKLVTSAEEVLEELNVRMAAQQADAREQLMLFDNADDTERALLAQLTAEPLHADELSALLGMPIAAVSGVLAMMELKGLVRQVGGMKFVLARRL